MADKDRGPLMTSCPICGYTDEASDAAILNDAIAEHIRTAHNLDPATLNTSSEIKDAGAVKNDFRESDAPGIIPSEAAGLGIGVLGHNYRINQ